MINRRGLITGLISLAAAPAIVRYSSLMPVKVIEPVIYTAWDIGVLDQTVVATYMYMVDGSIVVKELKYMDYYK